MTRAAAVVIALGVVGGGAAADTDADTDTDTEELDLEVRRGPIPTHLRMRPVAAVDEPDPATTPGTPTTDPDAEPDPDADPGTGTGTGTSTGTGVADVGATVRARDFDLPGVRRADEQVVFRLDLGFGVDGGSISGRRAVAGEPLSANDYLEVRAQAFGNLFVGTRGLFITPLSSYLSAGFRLTPSISDIAPLADSLDATGDVQIRAGWAEAANFLPGKLFRSLRVRAGRQYSYGPWPIHFDGSVVAWTSKALQVSALAGIRVDDFAPQGEPSDLPSVVALIVSADLGALGRWPITVRSTAMWLDSRRFTDLELGYRPRRGVHVVGSIRRIENRAARERATVRAQISEVTHLVVDVEHRAETDWRWDPSFVDPTEPGAARPYLELPVTVPQFRGTIRGGTVLFNNIDLYLRTTLAVDLVKRQFERTGYAELGGALEVRLQRSIAVTVSGMLRDYELTDATQIGTYQEDIGNEAQPLIDPAQPEQLASIGQEYFGEGGVGFRYSAGARRFSCLTAEGYLRRTKFAGLYSEDTPEVGDALDLKDTRFGGRFSLDGWLTPRLRLHLEYDLSSTIDSAPEINGWKVLRALAEGSF